MERTIRVKGRGSMRIRPDRIRLNIYLEEGNRKYDVAMERAVETIERIKKVLNELGFSSTDLKTKKFNVETVYESYQDSKQCWKKRFEKYKVVNSLRLEMEMDHKLLGKVLYNIVEAKVYPEFRVEYTVKDKEATKNEILQRAVEDSMKKANILAKAAKITLGELLNIDYSWGEIDFVSLSEREIMPRGDIGDCEYGAAFDLDMDPEDIDVTDTVTCVWKIG